MSDDTNYKGKKLSPLEYDVIRNKATEAPFSGEYVHTTDKGMYVCKSCGQQLFDSNAKFDSKSGWPSFVKPIPGSVEYKEDNSHFMHRTEVLCSRCGAHLGHVFDDGPEVSDQGEEGEGKRFCINSVCLDLQKEEM